jgi:hypothetical protein
MQYLEIQKLIKQGQIKTAEKSLSEKSFREQQSSIHKKTIKKLQKKTQQLRKNFVKQNISKCKKYLHSNQLENAYQLILDLENIDSTNPKISKLKNKIVKTINKTLHHQSQDLLKQSQKEIQQLISQNQAQKALEITFKLNNLPETIRKNLELQTRRDIIDHKLKNNSKKLKNTPAPQKYDFIKNLYDLEPTYPQIQKKLLKARKELSNHSKIQKSNLLNQLTQETKILFNKKEFTKAKENSKRILSIDPNNRKGIKYYKKSEHCYYNDSYKKAYQILQSKN